MFEGMTIEFCYTKENGEKKHVFSESCKSEDFSAVVRINQAQGYKRLTLSIIPVQKLTIKKLAVKMPFSFHKEHRVFVNGYQSWTDSTEMRSGDKMKNISPLATPLMKKYRFDKYGDYTFAKYSNRRGDFHGFTYSYIRHGESLHLLGSLSERSGFTIIEHCMKKDSIILRKECEGLEINSAYQAFDIFYGKGPEDAVFDSYFNAMGIEKPKHGLATGWTSWYNYYQNIHESVIMENLDNFKGLQKTIDIFQIDDGYQRAVGDWLDIDATKFPNGMKTLADKIHKQGCQAGIWLAPFVCETNSALFREKQDWLIKDAQGEPLPVGSNWSGFYALDLYHPGVLEYLKKVFDTVLNDWGYDLVKLDFLYAVCLLPRKDKTRGQIMTEAMEFLRQCVGNKRILGCGVPLGPAFGRVDYCRIGCDVGLDWDDKFYMRRLHRERISTLNAIKNAIGRRHLNGRAFINDPDVFLLRDDHISLSEAQKETLAFVNNLFGGVLFTSDNIKKYSNMQRLAFEKAMRKENRRLYSVDYRKKNLAEVLYDENGTRKLSLINLSGKKQRYYSDVAKQSCEILPYKSMTITL
ncbi:MAG: alpha-galactosidase [Clostridia bacterium]|nr:alpha-galactosidase [Clostridia bacterium]